MVTQLAGFLVVCEAFLWLEAIIDLFRRVFEVKTARHMALMEVCFPQWAG